MGVHCPSTEFPATTLQEGVGWENQLLAEGGLRGTKGTCPLSYAFRVKVERWRNPAGLSQGAGDAHLSFHGFHTQYKRKSTGKWWIKQKHKEEKCGCEKERAGDERRVSNFLLLLHGLGRKPLSFSGSLPFTLSTNIFENMLGPGCWMVFRTQTNEFSQQGVEFVT